MMMVRFVVGEERCMHTSIYNFSKEKINYEKIKFVKRKRQLFKVQVNFLNMEFF